MKYFAINDGKGFRIRFPNGLTLSTQIGGGNYCDNYDHFDNIMTIPNRIECSNAEIAVWNKEGIWVTKKIVKKALNQKLDDNVMGYVSIEDWLKIFMTCKDFKDEYKKGGKDEKMG